MQGKKLRSMMEPVVRRMRRGPRKIWSTLSRGAPAVTRRVHIELRELSDDELRELSRALEPAVEGMAGVVWARVNPFLNRLVIEHDPGVHTAAELEQKVAEIESRLGLASKPFPVRDPEKHPGDAEPIRRTAVEMGAEAASLVIGLWLRRIGVKPLPLEIDLAALLTLVDGIPRVRKAVERMVSIASTELGLELARAGLQAVLQGSTGPLAGTLHRFLRLQELRARRALWTEWEQQLCGRAECHPGGEVIPVSRPGPRRQGPVEEYTNHAALASLGVFGLAATTTKSIERASGAIFAGVPRQARQGRDAFASCFGLRLAREGVMVLDPHALRKLDRIDTAVVDGALLTKDDPAARALIAAVHAAELQLVVFTGAPERVGWTHAHEITPHRPDDIIRRMQSFRHRVCLVAARPLPAYAAADLGVGLYAGEGLPPWGAHIICRDGLSDASLVVDAVRAARRASEQSVQLSMIDAGVGVVLAFAGLEPATTRRIMTAANTASIVSMLNAVRVARSISRRVPAQAGTEPPWHSLDPGEVLELLGSRPEGLLEAEAAERRKPAPKPPSPLVHFGRMVFEELANPMAPILAAGAGLSALTGGFTDAGLIAGVLVLNGVFGGAERYRTDKALEAMARTERRKVRVRRGQSAALGEATTLVQSDQLVPGDVVELEAGDVVPADCRILEAVALEADESHLTGESFPVTKRAGATAALAVAERHCMLYDGTSIAAGRASAVVVAVGEQTEARRAILLGHEEPPASGVERRLDSLAALTAPVAAGGALALAGAGLLRKRPSSEVINTGISLAVAAVPEGLPLLATLAQLAAANRLSAKGALVRNPRAIEALGRVDVICADKTGTLTEGRIALRLVSDGEVEQGLDDLDAEHRLILAVALRASPETANGEVLPHMTDRALVEAAHSVEVRRHEGIEEWRPVDELPFEPSRGYHAGLSRIDGGHVISVKGAPELILPRCRRWIRGDDIIELTDDTRAYLQEQSMSLARRGYRVLAVAEREADGDKRMHDERVQRLAFCGFVAFTDPIRASAKEAVDDLRRAGVDVVMVTGDHPSTAEAIAAELELRNCAEVVTGPELDAMSDPELDEVVERVTVFARVTPVQKVRIVRALKHAGRVVAMTGDGANDAPAIRLADVGIALGEGATAAARNAADMIVIDERIETIVHAALEGRALWTSVRDAVSILVGGNLGEIGFTVLGGLFGSTSPLNARQLLLVNLLTDSLPALAVALRPPVRKSPEELMREGPDASLGAALTRDLSWRAAVTGATAAGAWLTARFTAATSRRASTVALLALTGTQLTQTLMMGGRSVPVLATGLGSLGALLAVVETPGLSHFFGCRPLGPVGLVQAATATAVGTGAAVLGPRLRRRLQARAEERAEPGQRSG